MCSARDCAGDRESHAPRSGRRAGHVAAGPAAAGRVPPRLARAKAGAGRHRRGSRSSFCASASTRASSTRGRDVRPVAVRELGLTPDPAMPLVMSPGGWDVLSVERLSMLRARAVFMVVDTRQRNLPRRRAQTPIWQRDSRRPGRPRLPRGGQHVAGRRRRFGKRGDPRRRARPPWPRSGRP